MSAPHPIVIELLKAKNLDKEGIEDFLSWDLKKLPPLTSLKDTQKASERILNAIEAGERIGVYGDYDVDGTTSCALLFHFFKMINVEVELFQPSRFVEGYGLHPSSIDGALEKDIKVLITVDCGITNNEAADYAKEKGIDLIITDHHEDGRDEMPVAHAIVNPSRRDEDEESPLKSLAGVGVAFALCWQIREDMLKSGKECESIYPLLQFVAIGTICDLAKLNPMNLKLVRHGLKQIPGAKYAGINAFFNKEERDRKFVPSEKLSFGIGPMINSKGRLDHPEKALELLTTDDPQHANFLYRHLEICNNERKMIQGEVFKGAKEQVQKQISNGEHLISIVYNEEWHEGVIGIVASRLVEEYKVPAIVFTNSSKEGIIKASARSAGELDLFVELQKNSDLFVKFGGHKAAAGLSMDKENLPILRANLKKQLEDIPAIERTKQDYYDLEIDPVHVTPALVRALEMLEPFGMGNSKPIFKSKNLKLDSYNLMKDVHVRWNLSSAINPRVKLRGVSFNYVGKWGQTHPGELYENQNIDETTLTAFYTISINRFNGNEYIQLMIDKITSDDL